MKFYPFRLFDVMLPVAVAVALAGVANAATKSFNRDPEESVWGATRAPLRVVVKRFFSQRVSYFMPLVALAAFVFAALRPAGDRNPSGWSAEHWADWVETCGWIERHTPADALILTPRYNFAFKWYAQRAEYVAYKDCPQDASSLIEWKRRLDLVHRWRVAHFTAGFDDAAVAELRRETGVEYVLAWANRDYDPYRSEPLFRNRSFSVYRVP